MRFHPASWRRAAVTGLAALAVGAALWSVAWLVIAERLEGGIEDWVGERRAEGWRVAHGPVQSSGFPHRWRVRIDRPRLSGPRGAAAGFSWSGPWIELGWAPWAPRRLALRTAGAHDLGFAGGAGGRFRLAAAEITGRIGFGDDGAIARIDIGGDTITLIPPGAPQGGGPFRVNRVILRANLRPDTVAPPATPPPWLALEADIFGLTLPKRIATPLGRTIGRIAGQATVRGRLPAARPAEALAVWRDRGGVVEISRFTLGWGALTASGAGTLALDAGLQPICALTARIAGYGEVIDRLSAAGKLSLGQRLVAKVALGALARTPEGGGRPEVEVAVSVQNGVLTVGPVPLLRLGRISWR